MGFVFLILFSLLVILITNITKLVFRHNFISYVLTFAFVFVVSGLVTYTPDWFGYELWLSQGMGKDLFFNFFARTLLPSGEGYQFMHMSFTAMYAMLLVYFVSRFTEHTYVVCLLFVVAIYLFYVTQIRFFLAYFSLFIGLYFWMVQQRRAIAVVMILFALANHSSMILFLLLFPLFYIKIENLLLKCIQVLVITSGVYFVFQTVISFLPQNFYLVMYFTEASHHSSFMGGLFTFLPTIVLMIALHFYAMYKTNEYPELLNDMNFQFLYRFMLIPLVFFGIATERQVLGHRFILTSVLFQLLLLAYVSYYNSPKQNAKQRWIVVAIIPFFVFYTYFLSNILAGSEMSTLVIKTIKSNPVLNYLLF